MHFKEKKFNNGAILIYSKVKRKHTAINAGFVFGDARQNYSNAIPHFCEQMLFNGTQKHNKEELTQIIDQTFSFKLNAITTLFYLYVTFCRSNRVLKPCCEVVSEMLLNTKFVEETLEKEKGVIKEESRTILNSPIELLSYAKDRTYYNKYTENMVEIGTEEEINAVTVEALQKFVDDIFISGNFIISIQGGISFFKAKQLAKKYFVNKLRNDNKAVCEKNIVRELDKPGNLNVEYGETKNAMCVLMFKIDKEFENMKTKKILQMLTRIYSGINSGLLGKLRDEGLVYNLNISYTASEKSFYRFYINWQCSESNVNRCIDLIGKFFRELRTSNIITDEVLKQEREKMKIEKDEASSVDIFPSFCISDYLFFGNQNKNYYKKLNKALKNLKAQEILDFCQKAFVKKENIYMTILCKDKTQKFYSYEEIQDILTKD